jgi:hypothetical protein
MLTVNKILDLIQDMGLLAEERTHMVKKITIQPFQGKVSVDVIIDEAGNTEHFHLPVFDFGDDE